MPRAKAVAIAERLCRVLTPAAERCEIVGSLRRGKATIGDLDLLVISKQAQPVFGQAPALPIDHALANAGVFVSKRSPRSRQLFVENVYVDVWLVDPATWGCLMAIRTGNSDFSHWLVTPRHLGGACPNDMLFKDARLWRRGYVLETPEEDDVFAELGLAWIEPDAREGGRWWLPFSGNGGNDGPQE